MTIPMDLKYALRQLLKAPKFTALTLMVLVGGLSISLFTFSFLYSLIYKPIPLADGENIYRLSVSLGGEGRRVPAYEYLSIRDKLTNVVEQGVFNQTSVRLSIQDSGKSLFATHVEQSMFSFTQVEPIMGRTFDEQDMRSDAKATVVISYHLWDKVFQQDSNIVGKQIRLNGTLTEVIGVMPKGFGFPVNSRLWLPIPRSLVDLKPESDQNIQAYVKLSSDKSPDDAEKEIASLLNVVYQQTAKTYKKKQAEVSATLLTFPQSQTDGQGSIVFMFFNLIAFFILLLACINVGNLLLARAIEKQKETAIRAALGAPINRLVLQIMLEGIIITLIGGVLSVLLVGDLLSYTHVVLHTTLSDNLPFWWGWGMDKETLVMAGVFTAITLFLASFLPARKIANQDINATLRDGTRGAQSKRSGKASRVLVTVQVFLISTLMLIGSLSAFISNYLLTIDLGENFDQMIEGTIYLPEEKYPLAHQQVAFFEQFRNRLNLKDNVIDTTIRMYRGRLPLKLDSLGLTDEANYPKVDTMSVFGNTEFFGAKLVEGRHLDERDNHNNRRAVLISQSLAKRYWPNQEPLERTIQVKIDDKMETLYVVGIVTDRVNTVALMSSKDAIDEIYLSGYQFTHNYYRVFFKYHGQPEAAIESFYQVLFSLDKTIEPYRVEPADKNMDMMRSAMQLTSNITFLAGGFALLLALTGIYGLTANAVARRTHEIGIRRAVGATDRQIITLFIKQGSRQLIIGLALGLTLFTLMAFVFHDFTEGNVPIELYFILAAIVSISLTFVVMLAIYSPTSKAVEMEPSTALRYE